MLRVFTFGFVFLWEVFGVENSILETINLLLDAPYASPYNAPPLLLRYIDSKAERLIQSNGLKSLSCWL